MRSHFQLSAECFNCRRESAEFDLAPFLEAGNCWLFYSNSFCETDLGVPIQFPNIFQTQAEGLTAPCGLQLRQPACSAFGSPINFGRALAVPGLPWECGGDSWA